MKKISTHEISSKIRQYILDKNLRAGDKLPSENEFINLLGIGRSSLRESLRMLEGMGILTVKQGKGRYVENPEPSKIPVPIKRGESSFLQVLEIRQVFEMGAVLLAIENADDKDLEKIKDALEMMEMYDKKDTRSKEARESDLAFHKCIYESSKNLVFLELLDSISESYFKFWQDYMSGMFSVTLKYHRLIYLAIKSKDKKAAYIVVCDMIQAMRDSLEFLAEAGGEIDEDNVF